MKNLSIIFLLVLLLFGIVFAAYIIVFKAHFSSGRLINATKHLSRMTFQRDVKISGMSFSPFGVFQMRSFSMAAKGGFEKGSMINIGKVVADVKLTKLMRRELYVSELTVDGVNVKLNYENKRKFDYASFFSNVKFVLMQDGKRIGIVKKAEIENIVIKDASVDIMTDCGNLKFKNIVLMSDLFEAGQNFSGKISFDFEFENKQYNSSSKFIYDVNLQTLEIIDLVCKECGIVASGAIKFLDGGSVSLEFSAAANKKFVEDVLSKTIGNDYLTVVDSSSEKTDNIKIIYSKV